MEAIPDGSHRPLFPGATASGKILPFQLMKSQKQAIKTLTTRKESNHGFSSNANATIEAEPHLSGDSFARSTISAGDLILPLFIVPGRHIKREMNSLPGNYHLSVDCLVEEAKELRDLGIPAIFFSACLTQGIRETTRSAPTRPMESCSKPCAR